eukprot:TRINITY_DN10315_c0_g2_i1.p1 TRINITY_DN10315_c0_g2~~TRINITY_DN10315_c0_g2_i1.p1  ORF type:complete len:127 (+),score=33.22 TRINITY_DN10315_c0_g2_i1:43-423(+)
MQKQEGPSVQQISQVTERLFEAVEGLVHAELKSVGADYELIENMNTVSKERYDEMTKAATHYCTEMQEIQQTYANLQPALHQIVEIDTQLTELEEITQMLDSYTKQLEARFKKVEKDELLELGGFK